MKPANFPERKRQRRLRALERLAPRTAGKPEKGIKTRSNDAEAVTLHNRSARPLRGVRTKKNRAASGALMRA